MILGGLPLVTLPFKGDLAAIICPGFLFGRSSQHTRSINPKPKQPTLFHPKPVEAGLASVEEYLRWASRCKNVKRLGFFGSKSKQKHHGKVRSFQTDRKDEKKIGEKSNT